jgi:hypothetical protein
MILSEMRGLKLLSMKCFTKWGLLQDKQEFDLQNKNLINGMWRFSYFQGEIDCQGGQWFAERKFLLFNAWGMTNFGGKIMSLRTLIICKTKASLWGFYYRNRGLISRTLYICIDSEMKLETNKRHPKSWKVTRNSNHLKCQASTTKMPLAPSIWILPFVYANLNT